MEQYFLEYDGKTLGLIQKTYGNVTTYCSIIEVTPVGVVFAGHGHVLSAHPCERGIYEESREMIEDFFDRCHDISPIGKKKPEVGDEVLVQRENFTVSKILSKVGTRHFTCEELSVGKQYVHYERHAVLRKDAFGMPIVHKGTCDKIAKMNMMLYHTLLARWQSLGIPQIDAFYELPF